MATIQHILPLLLVLPLIAAWKPDLRSNEFNSIRRAALLRDNEDSSNFGVYQRSDPCRLNLGGRCATEIASDLVKAWHYLNSSNSPGRKRRDVREALRTILRHSALEAAADNRL